MGTKECYLCKYQGHYQDDIECEVWCNHPEVELECYEQNANNDCEYFEEV